jgi:hypothetical protein
MTLRVVLACFALGACSAGAGTDAQMPSSDAPPSRDTPASSDAFDPWAVPDACSSDASPPASVEPPSPACGPDVAAMLGYDPCLHYVACYGGWSYGAWVATYIDGRCEAGTCVFTEPPVLECCEYGCFGDAAQGRCAHLPPGAPTAP